MKNSIAKNLRVLIYTSFCLFLFSFCFAISGSKGIYNRYAKNAPVGTINEAKLVVMANKQSFAENDEFVLSLNLIDFTDLQGVSVSFKANDEIFETVENGKLTDSYINKDTYLLSETKDGIYNYYSICKNSAKVYDWHNNNSLFTIKFKAKVAIENLSTVFRFSNDSAMLDFFENIFVVKISDSNAKEIDYTLAYGNYENYSSFVPGTLEIKEAGFNTFEDFINEDELPENVVCEADLSRYEAHRIGQTSVDFVFYNKSTGYITRYEVPVTNKDITKPTISLKGDEEVEALIGLEYVDQGINVLDDFDVSPVVRVNSTVNTNKLGSYIVEYTVTDESGNKSQISRRVNVVERGSLDNSEIIECNKGKPFEIVIKNQSEKSIVSFTLEFEFNKDITLAVDSGCTLNRQGNKLQVSGSFNTPVSSNEKLFAFKGTIPTGMNHFENLKINLSSNNQNIVNCSNGFIDGNYKLSGNQINVGIFGDVNQDDQVNLLDALLLREYLNGSYNIAGEVLELCDVNLDQNIDAEDVAMIRQYLVKKVEKLGA